MLVDSWIKTTRHAIAKCLHCTVDAAPGASVVSQQHPPSGVLNRSMIGYRAPGQSRLLQFQVPTTDLTSRHACRRKLDADDDEDDDESTRSSAHDPIGSLDTPTYTTMQAVRTRAACAVRQTAAASARASPLRNSSRTYASDHGHGHGHAAPEVAEGLGVRSFTI